MATRLDYLLAHLAASFAALFAKEGTEIELRDFMMRWGARPELTREQEAALGRGIVSALGAS